MTMLIEQLMDVSVALGKGVYSVGEDIIYGIERTAEGLGASGSDRISEISFENEQIIKIIMEALKYPFKEKGPIYRAIKLILIEYYSKFPEEALKAIAKKGSIGVGFLAGRMLIGRELAGYVTRRILLKIAASEGFKQLSSKLGISAVSTASGVGTVVGLLMIQGVAQRASKGREKLESSHPRISKKLKENGGLDLLYFLIESPMTKHLKAIKEAMVFPGQFESTAKRLYGH